MTTRRFVADALKEERIFPTNQRYSYHVELFLVNQFEVQTADLSKKQETDLKNLSKNFASEAKKLYVASSRKYDNMVKKSWFDIHIKNPVELLSEKPIPKKKGRKKKAKRGPKEKSYSECGTTQQWVKGQKISDAKYIVFISSKNEQ